ncbi:hypothetical protein, partial [Extensimonas sp. H3M7-6]|uniref:hypothetical protein n=1 Tax=Extensimonas soli TaxID=3031322 RepID=UPI0023D984DB
MKNNPACRATLPLLAASLLLSVTQTGMAAQAQTQAQTSAARIAAATRKVDGNFIRANAAQTKDWPSYG